MSSTAELFASAWQHHQANQLPQAEAVRIRVEIGANLRRRRVIIADLERVIGEGVCFPGNIGAQVGIGARRNPYAANGGFSFERSDIEPIFMQHFCGSKSRHARADDANTFC